jgi:hypothetical protein
VAARAAAACGAVREPEADPGELLTRLETRGVYVRRNDQHEVVRLLYVARRHQVQALAATLALERLE